MAIAEREVVLASAARTATITTTLDTRGAAGCYVYLDVTVDPSSAIITMNIDGYDSFADESFTLLDGATVNGVSFNVYRVWPGVSPAANLAANEWLPDRIKIHIEVNDTDSMTYSVHVVWLR